MGAAQNRVTGGVKVVSGLGGVVAAACFGSLGHWWALPPGLWALGRRWRMRCRP